MRKLILMVAVGLTLLLCSRSLSAQTAQSPAPMPTRFEIYYESGWGGPGESNSVAQRRYDAFDSAKKVRLYDAQGGQIKYQAELTDEERKAIYESVMQNSLLTVKKEFIDLGRRFVSPNMVGRLRIEIDGSIKEIWFKRFYGMVVTNDSEWNRLQNVIDVIEKILKAKDQKQDLPRHNAYN